METVPDMSDLVIASVVLGVLTALSFVGGLWLSKRKQTWPAVAAGVFAVLATTLYLLLLRDSVLLVRLMPVSAVPVAGDPLPILGGLFAGLLAGHAKVPVWRRLPVALIALGAGWFGPVRAMTNQPPQTFAQWQDGVCLQTSFVTCGPAAAATLLSYHGIDASETQLAELCLTNDKGTHLTGLYRGLSLLSPDDKRVRVEQLSVAEVMARPDAVPAIVSLRLTEEMALRDSRFTEEWGWDIGMMHTVVLIGFPSDKLAAIADPGVGRETWTVKGLEELWTGEVIYLEQHD